MPAVAEAHSALEAELATLKDRYIAKYVPTNPEDGPETFEYDVKSYAILAHAAFEEFSELISEQLMEHIVSEMLHKRLSIGTACFLMAYGAKIEPPEGDEKERNTCFNYVRLALADCKQAHSRALMGNHGFSLKYLRAILTPVGINIPDGPALDSLQKLADARGSFAHGRAKKAHYGEYKKATRPLTPEEALAIVSDCVGICTKIKEQAETAMSFPGAVAAAAGAVDTG